jgi:hypothetical protein
LRLFLVPLLLLTSAAAAQMSDVTITPHSLRTMSTAQLRSSLFGSEAPDFVESWVEGPTLRSTFLNIQLATRPRPTAYLGLCSVEIGSVSARWEIGRQIEDAPLKMAKGRVVHRFLLTDDEPSLVRGSAEAGACSRKSALFSDIGPQPIDVFYADGRNLITTNADAARFGYTALRAAQKASTRLPLTTQRCASGFTDIPLACNAPAAFLRTRKLREVSWLMVTRCDGAPTLCLDIAIARFDGCDLPVWAGPCGEDHVVVTTDLDAPPEGDTLDATHIKGIEIRAGSTPVA